MEYHKSEAITFSVGCFSIVAVIIAIVIGIYFGTAHSNQLYYATMQQCIEARGTWVPSINSGACVMNGMNGVILHD